MNHQSLAVIAFYLSLLAVLGTVWVLVGFKSLNKLRKTFFAGRRAADLEDVIRALQEELKNLRGEQLDLERALKELQDNFAFAVQKVGIVRFNPFADAGGDFSFCLALLNGYNSGIIITSMHGREQNRTYTKKITNGKSEVRLTEEEQQAIAQAISEK